MNSQDDIRVDGRGNALEASEAGRKAPRRAGRRVLNLAAICALLMFASMILPPYLFIETRPGASMSVPEFFAESGRRFQELLQFLTGAGGSYEFIPCGVLLAAMMGAALGMCGSVYQGAFRNPLAAPKTLGVMSGGALGSFIYFMTPLAQMGPQFISEDPTGVNLAEVAQWYASLDPLSYLWVMYGQQFCSVAGCFLIVGIVVFISSVSGRGKLSNITLIIAGQVFSMGITGLILYMRYVYTATGDADQAEAMMEIENYALGGTYTTQDLALVGIPLLACIVAVLLMRNKLTMLSFGDEEAQSMGVDVNKWRYIMVAICTFMTGWAISFMGHVAYLGFISAHVSRRLVGPDMRYLLPASLFVGAIFITFFYMLTRCGLPFAPQGSVGMYTSIVGAALFLVIALRQRGRSTSDWQ